MIPPDGAIPTGRGSSSVTAAALAADVWMTTAEAAAYTRRHPVTVRKAAASKELASTQAGRGRGRRYRREWLDAWLSGVTASSAA